MVSALWLTAAALRAILSICFLGALQADLSQSHGEPVAH